MKRRGRDMLEYRQGTSESCCLRASGTTTGPGTTKGTTTPRTTTPQGKGRAKVAAYKPLAPPPAHHHRHHHRGLQASGTTTGGIDHAHDPLQPAGGRCSPVGLGHFCGDGPSGGPFPASPLTASAPRAPVPSPPLLHLGADCVSATTARASAPSPWCNACRYAVRAPGHRVPGPARARAWLCT